MNEDNAGMGSNSWRKERISLLKVELIAAEKGAIVSVPTSPARYDLVIDWRGKLYRTQVKYASSGSKRSSGVVTVGLRRGFGGKRRYLSDEIDVVLVYVPQIDSVCWFGPEVFQNRTGIILRYEPAKNNNTKKITLAQDHIW